MQFARLAVRAECGGVGRSTIRGRGRLARPWLHSWGPFGSGRVGTWQREFGQPAIMTTNSGAPCTPRVAAPIRASLG